jgi:hypothetical protein
MFEVMHRLQFNTARALDYMTLYPSHLLDEPPDPPGPGRSRSSGPFPLRTSLHASMTVGEGLQICRFRVRRLPQTHLG